MTAAPQEFDRLPPPTERQGTTLSAPETAQQPSQNHDGGDVPALPPRRVRPHNERARTVRRDNPDAPPARQRRPLERQPRTYTQPEFAPRRKQAQADEPPTPQDPTPEQLDRWDEEWRDEWDRGDVDDSAAYEDDTLDVADQVRDVEWLLDALDALDDGGDNDDSFEWED